jgi:hypothetical protein
MCGTRPNGLKCHTKQENSTHNCAIDGVGLWAISLLAFPLKKSDGMVPLDSCKLRTQSYAADWQQPWYTMGGNHEDGTCRNGDETGADRQPCRWYAQRVAESVRDSATARYACPVAGSSGVRGCVRNDSAGVFGKKLRKRVFWHHFILKMILLPRQARDKHRENSQKDAFL